MVDDLHKKPDAKTAAQTEAAASAKRKADETKAVPLSPAAEARARLREDPQVPYSPQSLGVEGDYGPQVKVDPPKGKEPKQTPAQQEAQKRVDTHRKVEQGAQTRAGTINARLARDGSPNRIMAMARDGEEKYFWGNFVPTREMNDEELAAVESVK